MLVAVWRSETDNTRVNTFVGMTDAQDWLLKCAHESEPDFQKIKTFKELMEAEGNCNFSADIFIGEPLEELMIVGESEWQN